MDGWKTTFLFFLGPCWFQGGYSSLHPVSRVFSRFPHLQVDWLCWMLPMLIGGPLFVEVIMLSILVSSTMIPCVSIYIYTVYIQTMLNWATKIYIIKWNATINCRFGENAITKVGGVPCFDFGMVLGVPDPLLVMKFWWAASKFNTIPDYSVHPRKMLRLLMVIITGWRNIRAGTSQCIDLWWLMQWWAYTTGTVQKTSRSGSRI